MNQDLDALPLPSFVKTSPERIYLVIGDNLEDGDEFNDLDEVTWCQDKQYDTDIEYVRADVVCEIVAAELRKAQEGREPVAWRVRRSDGEHELFFHEPTAKQRAECFVPHSSAEPLFTSPPPKSDESSVERSLLRKIRQQDFLCDSLRAAIDAALAAQQSKGEA
jgi:hypothetical protein